MNIMDEIEESCNKTAFPDVRCPFGCTTFKDKEYIGYISLQHFLNNLFPSFTFFNADYRKHLNGARSDWLDEEEHNCFIIKPSIYLSSQRGPLIVTCSDHNKGSQLQYVHPPTNPATGSFPLKYSNRLAPAVIQSKVAHPMKAKYSVHTYCIVAEDVGYAGASSQRKGLKRKWDVHAEDTMPSAEGLTAKNRSDVAQLLDDLVATGEIKESIKNTIVSNPCPSDAVVQQALNSATNVPFNIAMGMKRQAENNANNKFYHAFFAQINTDFGCQPPSVPTNIEPLLWFLLCNMVLNPEYCSLVNENAASDTALCEHVSKLASSCFNHNPTIRPSQRTKTEVFLTQFLGTFHDAYLVEKVTKLLVSCTPQVPIVDVLSRNDVQGFQQIVPAVVFK